MMFQRVQRPEFYKHVSRLREAARRNVQTFNRRESDDRVTYEVNGVPYAQRTLIDGGVACFYILR